MVDDDEARETPPAVIGAVAAGTAALPFLVVYATIFIVHGGFHHVVPPDVTGSNSGELAIGVVCLALFFVTLGTLLWLLSGFRRWPFVVVQAVLFAVALDFLIDPTKGGRLVSGLIVVTTLTALVLAAHPQSWEHRRQRCPQWVARVFGRRPAVTPARNRPMPAGSAPVSDTVPGRSVARSND